MKKRVLVCLASAALAAAAFADGLPAGYTEVPYLKLNGQCRVKTGLTPTSTDIVEMSWRPSTVSGNQNLWCSRISGTQQFTVFMIGNKVRFDRGGAQVTGAETIAAATDYTIVANYGTLAGTVTNAETGEAVTSVTMASGDYTPGSELCIFASHDASVDAGLNNYGSYRFYSFRLKASNGTVKCDLVPAKRDSDGTLGVYDVKRSLFLENDLTGAFTTAGMTITPSDPQWGAALSVSDELTIDAGDGRLWTGSITVRSGGTLRTRGNLTVSGATALNAGGALDVETGNAYFAFAGSSVVGAVTVRAGAELKMRASEAFHGDATASLDLYGTLNVAGTRQRLDNLAFVRFRDGSRVIGNGDGNGGLDFGCTAKNRIVVEGAVLVDTPVKCRTGQTLQVACFDGATVGFPRGFLYGGAGNGKGNMEQVAATAEEGNTGGTCAGARIEVGHSNFQGKMTFISKGVVTLVSASQSYSVDVNSGEVEFRAESALDDGSHAIVKALPAVTAANGAAVRLSSGGGVIALRDAAPAFPLVFDGATLQIAADAPVALAAGSTAASATVVGVEGLAANTAATLFTGADSSFDVSKISASAMHNGVAIGTPAATSLSGADVVTAGVAAYDAAAWIEPYIKATALIWLDASDAANFVFKDNTFGLVETWKDKSAYKRDAKAYTVPSHSAAWGTLGVAAGVPAYLMGECNSGIDLSYDRMTTIRTAFWVMSVRQDQKAFWLGDTSAFRFHRGNGGAYCYNNANAYLREGPIYCDGAEVTGDKYTVKVPTDRHVYSTVTTKNCESNRLTCDRDCDTYGRHGGRELSELIAFPAALSDADREAIEAYLAAKWMGANPSAAGTDGTYAVSGDMEVDGTLGGDKSLAFAEGASVSVSNPSATAPMLSTTGSVTIPAGSPLAVTVDAGSLVPGTYTVMQAASGITSLSQFNATAQVGAGATATFSVADGKLMMTITASSAVASQTWRPQSAADLGWNSTSANWLYDGGATGGFIGYVPAFIDGGEAVSGDITVTGTQTAGPITFTGAKDYTLKGDGVIAGGDTVTFGGTGTVTLDGVSFGGQDIVVKDGQKVVLGFGASQKSLGEDSGSAGGKVTVKDGGQLNINDTETTSTTTSPRHEITHTKTFSIAGDGPDGRGALINDALDGRGDLNPYGSQFRRIELEGDATVGGTHRMEVRAKGSTAATATPGIYGPGKRLTVKSTNPYGFGIVSQPINVGAITISEGATLRPEAIAESQLDIPGGITLDGGIIHGYGTTYPASVPIIVGAGGGAIDSQNGTTTFKGPVNVPEGGTLTLRGSYTMTFSGAITNNGTIASTAGTMNFNGAIENNGAILRTGGNAYFAGPYSGAPFEQTNGDTYLANGFTAGDLDFSMAAGHLFLREGMKAGVINVSVKGGVPGFYPGSGTAPQFTEFNVTKTSDASGYGFDIRPQATGMMDVPGKVNVNYDGAGTIYVYGAARDGQYGMALNLSGSVDTLIVGYDANHAGDLRLKAGSDLTAKKVYTGYNNSGTSHGGIVIDAGAKLTATSELFMGRYGGAPSTMAVQLMDVAGVLDAAGIKFCSAYDTPRTETYIREGGVVKVNDITMNRSDAGGDTKMNNNSWAYGSGVAAAEGRHWLIMEGGRHEMGGGGLLGQRVPGVTKIDLQNGELVNVKAAWGGAQGFPVFFGYEKLGGSFTFDLDEYYVSWNQGLSGASDLTIKGSADFTGHRKEDRMQGVMLGKVTVENTAANDLRVTSAFSGGLKLAEGVNAEVAKYSDERYPYAVAGYVIDQMAETAWSYPFVSANFWNFTAKNYSSGSAPYSKHSTWAGRGEFYVPAEKAGKWSFAGQCDDWVRLDVDGVQVMRSASKCAVAQGTVELAEGWHKFTLALTDWEGGAGPSNAGWKDVMAVGFIVGESTSTAPGDYTPFKPGASLGDGATLQVRPKANACVWSWQNGNGSWNTTENWSHIKCLDSVEYMHRYGNSGTDATGYFNNKKVSRFQGWFKVEENQGGQWSFDMHYDDYKMLVIDGVTLINVGSWGDPTNAKVTLAPGWHRWEARVGDNTGGYGPNNDKNKYWTLSYVAPDDPAEKQWIETNLKLAATLGDIAVLEPSGIYRELELGEGATLMSAGTMAMPIFGTLKGTGTLAGAFEFAGGSSCWEVEGKGNRRELAKAVFAAPTGATFRGLGKVKATFDGRPVCGTYLLAEGVADVSQEDVAGVAVEVTDGDRDYSEKFSLVVQGASLLLKNASPGGMTLYVR
ncbi:MAG: hypothetical protein IKL96_02340 [Kiritimatiellae bacterium]|nr:hypothetical protein [Kiritimatiellia bacterium]